jgi:hypothetical protein
VIEGWQKEMFGATLGDSALAPIKERVVNHVDNVYSTVSFLYIATTDGMGNFV